VKARGDKVNPWAVCRASVKCNPNNLGDLVMTETVTVDFEKLTAQVEDFLRKRFAKYDKVYPSEIADALGIDYEAIREIVARMINEKKLEVARE